MAIFSKKRTLEDILNDIDALSPEDKEKLKEHITPDAAASEESHAEPEVTASAEEEAPAEAAETPEVTEENAEPVAEPTEDAENGAEGEEITEPTNEPTPEAEEVENKEADATAEILKGITDRLGALEGVIGELQELKTKMDEYVSKQKDSFGYHSDAGANGEKTMDEMSAAELKHKLLYN